MYSVGVVLHGLWVSLKALVRVMQVAKDWRSSVVGEVCRDCTGCSYAGAELRDSLIEVVCDVDQEYGELMIGICYTITL